MRSLLSFVAVLVGALVQAEPVATGLWKTFVYDRPDTTPVVFGGACRTRDVRAVDCCIYLDVFHPDGSVTWSVRAFFDQGTHDWQKTACVYVPKKPIARIEAYVLCRNGLEGDDPGQADFRDVFLERRQGTNELVGAVRVTNRPYRDTESVWATAFEGTNAAPLVTECPEAVAVVSPLAADAVTVWTTDSMRRVTPLTFPAAAERAEAPRLAFDVARRGRASAQLNLSTGAAATERGVAVEFSACTNAAGGPLKGRLVAQRVGYVARVPGYQPHPLGSPRAETWQPEILLPMAPMRLRPAATQGVWVTVETDAEAVPGDYSAEACVRAAGKVLGRVPVSVRVRSFAQPDTFGLETSFSLMDGYLRQQYPADWRKMKRRAIDVLLDHRLNPDDISRTTPPEIDDLVHMRSRGMNRFTVLNIVPQPKNQNTIWTCYVPPEEVFNEGFYPSFKARLDPYMAELRRHGLEKFACLYGFDERGSEYYPGIAALWRRLHADFPELPVLTTSKQYRDNAALEAADFHCPVTSDYDPARSEAIRAGGRRVWWYTCCGPWAPWANMASFEFPPIEGRILLGFMTYLAKADGFLFWHVNFWQAKGNEPLDAADTYFPDWSTRDVGSACSGDGVFLYPGRDDIYPSIRLAQLRDGVQDYEWLQLLERRTDRATAEAFCRELVTSVKVFTRDPAKLLAVRRRLGDAVEAGARRR